MVQSVNYLFILLYVIIPIVGSIVTFAIKTLLSRIDVLEKQMNDTQSEVQVRQLIKDRYDPLSQDIRDIKEKLDKLFDLYINEIKVKRTDQE